MEEKIFEVGQYIYTLQNGKIDQQMIFSRKIEYIEEYHTGCDATLQGPFYSYSIEPFDFIPINTNEWFSSQEELFESIKYTPRILATPTKRNSRKKRL